LAALAVMAPSVKETNAGGLKAYTALVLSCKFLSSVVGFWDFVT
jgi:hypothetical protein